MWLDEQFDGDGHVNSLEFASKRRIPVIGLSITIFFLEFNLTSLEQAFLNIGIKPPPHEFLHLGSWILLLYFISIISINMAKIFYEYVPILRSRAIDIDKEKLEDLKKRLASEEEEKAASDSALDYAKKSTESSWDVLYKKYRSLKQENSSIVANLFYINVDKKHIKLISSKNKNLFTNASDGGISILLSQLFEDVENYGQIRAKLDSAISKAVLAEKQLEYTQQEVAAISNPTDPKSMVFMLSEGLTDFIRVFLPFLAGALSLILFFPNYDYWLLVDQVRAR
jgi:hypothetical protein